jgi:hypothetical protein
MRLEVKVVQWAPADERFHVIMSIVFEPHTGKSVDIVFERSKIGGCIFGVREPVVRPVVVGAFSDCPKDGTFRRHRGNHRYIDMCVSTVLGHSSAAMTTKQRSMVQRLL